MKEVTLNVSKGEYKSKIVILWFFLPAHHSILLVGSILINCVIIISEFHFSSFLHNVCNRQNQRGAWRRHTETFQ